MHLMDNVKGRSKERKEARRRRRQRRASNVSDVLGMTPMRGDEVNLAEAAALQRAEAAAVHRHGSTPRPMSRMSWYASRVHLLPSPHASAMDWTLEVDEVQTDTDEEVGFADDSEDEDYDEKHQDTDQDTDQDEDEQYPEPKPTQSDLDFIVDPVDEDDRDETYVVTDVDTAEDDDGVEEELQLALLLSTGRLNQTNRGLGTTNQRDPLRLAGAEASSAHPCNGGKGQ